jgi:hypothetical protein
MNAFNISQAYNHKHHSINNITTSTQYTRSLCGNPMWEKNIKFFSYMSEEIHSYEAPTSLFSSYNRKEATTPWFLRLQPEGSYKSMILW